MNKSAASPTVVTLQALFAAAPGIPETTGTGVFIDPTLILTSARAVARLSSSVNHGRVLHKALIGKTAAVTRDAQLLKTTPLAVNFGTDLAVLKVVGKSQPSFPLAKSQPSMWDVLTAISVRENYGVVSMKGCVTSAEETGMRPKAPWPLDDELPWMVHYSLKFPDDSPVSKFGRNDTGVVTWATGSPWFNLDNEIVGVSSWEAPISVLRLGHLFSVGFAVPPVCIGAVLDYVKSKGPDDPIVMDSWIESHEIPGVDEFDVRKEREEGGGDFKDTRGEFAIAFVPNNTR